MVLKSILALNKIGVHEIIIGFKGNGGEREHAIKMNTYSSPKQVAIDLEQLASEIRRDEELK